MLEHIPHWLGSALKGLRAGTDKLAIVRAGLGSFAAIDLRSPAFANGARLPERFTADGAGVSPPLFWTGVPPEDRAAGAAGRGSPTRRRRSPLVHAIVWGMPAEDGQLAEGRDRRRRGGRARRGDVGRNSYLREGWLPPDPPTGHGEHHYAFQMFALAGARRSRRRARAAANRRGDARARAGGGAADGHLFARRGGRGRAGRGCGDSLDPSFPRRRESIVR